eukprot:TRINITY_DN23173_c0_g1_i2.p1 TRINITY_DN23173_c0_g1~~TRINITY_DN23173_c0_g1_i2.p1  ORF type:complete len:528 (+),score=139.18 TRINITY_DN23173_c0_g1_i2:207-1790(+)
MGDQLDDFRDILNNLDCEGLSGDCFSNEQLEEALEYASGDFDEAMVYLCTQAENDEDPEDWMNDGEVEEEEEDFVVSNTVSDDDSAEEAEHQLAHGQGDNGQTCRNGHPIELSTSTEGVYELGNWYCDLCGRSKPPGTERWLCKICSYDVCKRCIPGPDGPEEEDDDDDALDTPEQDDDMGFPSRMQQLLRQTNLGGLIRPDQLMEMQQQLGPGLLRAVERQLGPGLMLQGDDGGLGMGELRGMFAPAEIGFIGDDGHHLGSPGEDVCADDTVDWGQEISNLGMTGADTMASHKLACNRIMKRCGMGLVQLVQLCELGLLDALSEALASTQAHTDENNTLSGAMSLASLLACMVLDWKPTDKLAICRVISQRGVAHRQTPVFTDRVGQGSFVRSAAIVTGVEVRGKDQTRYLRGMDGYYLPMERPPKGGEEQEQLIVEISADEDTVLVSDAGEPLVLGAYERMGKVDGAEVWRMMGGEPGAAQMHIFRTGCSGAYRWCMGLMTGYGGISQFLTKNVECMYYLSLIHI